jgi:hypothetical protein
MALSRRRTWAIVILVPLGLLAVSCGGVLYVSGIWDAWRYTIHKRAIYDRFVKHGDHAQLLAACRDVLERREEFIHDGVSIDPNNPKLPAIIRDLEPAYILAPEDHLQIELHSGHAHFGFYAFPKFAQGSGGIELIPGLWAYRK